MIANYIDQIKKYETEKKILLKKYNDLIHEIFKKYDFTKNAITREFKFTEPCRINDLNIKKSKIILRNWYQKTKDDEYNNLINYLYDNFVNQMIKTNEYNNFIKTVEELNKMKLKLNEEYHDKNILGTIFYKHIIQNGFMLEENKNDLRKEFFKLELIDYNEKELLNKIGLMEDMNLFFRDDIKNSHIIILENSKYKIKFSDRIGCPSSYCPKYMVTYYENNKYINKFRFNNFCDRTVDNVHANLVDLILKYINLDQVKTDFFSDYENTSIFNM